MKQKLTLFFLACALCTTAVYAQKTSQESAKKGSVVGINLLALDIKTPETFRNAGNERTFTGIKDMDLGIGLSYWKGLTNTIDFSSKLNFLFHDYATDDRNEFTNDASIGIELEPTLNFRPYGDNNLIAPFLSAGVGGGYYSGEFGAYVPLGVGIQVNLKSETYLFVEGKYRMAISDKVLKDNLLYSFGVAQSLRKSTPPVAPPPPPPVILDRDNDGVPDDTDKCPDTPGLSSLMGCPDKDGDGIADGDDKCPDVKGLAKYQGCPVPDTDKDGINDEQDKCPTVPGLAKYQGCPMPDQDNDGVADEDDKCPTRPGPASNQGCPEIAKEVIEKVNMAAKNVFFATGSYKLLAKSYKSLNEVAELMKADESLMLDIDGHTDDVGSDENNQKLSENRAGSVREYLKGRGIAESRMVSTGYGEAKPVADNKTATGRAQNRRTEMTVRNF